MTRQAGATQPGRRHRTSLPCCPLEVRQEVFAVYARVGTYLGTAAELNRRRIATAQGGRWYASTVRWLVLSSEA